MNALQQAEVVRWIDQMRRFNAPAIFSQVNWGLADAELPEKAPSGPVISPTIF